MTATAPTTEIGYVQAPNYNWWLYDNETTPELVWPQSVYVYDQMRRQDSQVGSVLRAVTETLLRTPWRIDPAGARARVVKFVADDLGLPVVGKKPSPPPRSKDRFSWPAHLREALLMLPYGHSYFEQVYRVTPDGSAAHLRKLSYRPAKTIERIDVAPDGGLIAIKQYWTAADREPKPIPVNRLVAYIHAKEGGNWLGTSILRNCYKNWLLKDRLLRVQAQTIERNGMGIPLYKAQEGASPEDMAAGLAMAKAWRAGEAAGSAVPHDADLLLRGVEGTLPDAMPVIEYHDSQIARAVLAHFLNLGQQTGSWALGTTFADFFTMSLQTLAEQIRDTATQHIVEDLVDVNFGEDEPAPRLVFDEIGSRQAATALALKTLVDAGVIRPDEVLEESSRQQYGLPPADTSSVRTPPASAAPTGPTPQPPTQMGDMSVAAAAMGDPKGVAAGAVSARYDPAEPRDPHSGEWMGEELEHVAEQLLDSTKGGGHHVAAFDDTDGNYTSNGRAGRIVAVAMDEGGRAPWRDSDNALGDSLIVDAHSVAVVTADMEAIAARARDFKPTPEHLTHAEEHGPILITAAATADHRIAAYLDVNGDRMGFENTPFVAIQSDTISRLQRSHEQYPNLYPEGQDWTDDILGAPTDVFVIDARRVPSLTEAMRRMAGASPVAARFNPDEPRVPGGPHGGEWGHGGGVLSDALKLAGKIRLGDGETLARTDVFKAEDGSVIPMAWVKTPSGRTLRIGTGILDEDVRRWRGANKGSTVVLDEKGVGELSSALDAMRAAGAQGEARDKALEAHADDLSRRQRDLSRRQYPGLTKAQAKELDRIDENLAHKTARVGHLQEQQHQAVEALPGAARAEHHRLDAEIQRLSGERAGIYERFWAGGGRDRSLLDEAKSRDLQIMDLLDKQVALHRQREEPGHGPVGYDSLYLRRRQQLDRLMIEVDGLQAGRDELTGDPVPLSAQDAAALAQTSAQLDRAEEEIRNLRDGSVLASGTIRAQWGDLAYEASMNEMGADYHIAVRRPDVPADWSLIDDNTQTQLTEAELGKLQKMLATPPTVQAAAGHDTTPGHDELHHYWVAGPGLAEWRGSPKPFTTLVDLLVEHVKPPKPLATYKKWAAAWFHEVFGFWPGSDLNRVTHGHPPRGHVVGPG
jgi:hypothetical protein